MSEEECELPQKADSVNEIYTWNVSYLRETKGSWKRFRNSQHLCILKRELRLIVKNVDGSDMKVKHKVKYCK